MRKHKHTDQFSRYVRPSQLDKLFREGWWVFDLSSASKSGRETASRKAEEIKLNCADWFEGKICNSQRNGYTYHLFYKKT